MWPGFDGSLYTRDQFASHVAGLVIGPYAKFVCMHATGSPTLKEWEAYPEAQRIANLQRYYEQSLYWQHGPHLFVGPQHICGFSDLRTRGTHCSCWNMSSIGIETAGNWNTEDFESGDGAKVRDNFIFAVAVLHKHLGLRASPFREGVCGLHLHLMCKADGHFQCPKTGFDRDRMAKLIDDAADAMPPLAHNPAILATVAKLPVKPTEVAPVGSVAWIQERLNELGAIPALVVDGDSGPATRAATKAFQAAHGLTVDGWYGPKTADALRIAQPVAKAA